MLPSRVCGVGNYWQAVMWLPADFMGQLGSWGGDVSRLGEGGVRSNNKKWFEETREGKTQSGRRRGMLNLHKHAETCKEEEGDRSGKIVNMKDYTKGHLMCNLLVAKSAQMFALCIQRQPRGTSATNICPAGAAASALKARRSSLSRGLLLVTSRTSSAATSDIWSRPRRRRARQPRHDVRSGKCLGPPSRMRLALADGMICLRMPL